KAPAAWPGLRCSGRSDCLEAEAERQAERPRLLVVLLADRLAEVRALLPVDALDRILGERIEALQRPGRRGVAHRRVDGGDALLVQQVEDLRLDENLDTLVPGAEAVAVVESDVRRRDALGPEGVARGVVVGKRRRHREIA